MCARAPLCGSSLAILAEKATVRGIDKATIDCTGSAFSDKSLLWLTSFKKLRFNERTLEVVPLYHR